jgi:hypothetical protein
MHLFRVLVTSLLLAFSTNAVQALSYRLARLDNGRCAPKRDCATVFVATGEIERGELQSFRKFVGSLNQRSAGPRAFVIDSEGGNLAGAFGMGLVLQRIGIPVIVGSFHDGELGPGFCGSACVFVLMGGRSRQVAPGSVVAVHAPQRVPAQGEHGGEELLAADAKNSRQITKVLTNYARRTGVDPALVTLVMSVPPEERRALTPEELRRFRLVVVAK